MVGQTYEHCIKRKMSPQNRQPMSAILKEMALTLLAKPDEVPSLEAAAATLLLAHVAWQRANGDAFPDTAYAPVLAEMQSENPNVWNELTSADTAKLISQLVAYKWQHFPRDRRIVISCNTADSKVQVQWTEG